MYHVCIYIYILHTHRECALEPRARGFKHHNTTTNDNTTNTDTLLITITNNNIRIH